MVLLAGHSYPVAVEGTGNSGADHQEVGTGSWEVNRLVEGMGARLGKVAWEAFRGRLEGGSCRLVEAYRAYLALGAYLGDWAYQRVVGERLLGRGMVGERERLGFARA